ncbi:hypothetical protein DEJ23_12975 [Curtobacterium sp. MCSS17_008]|uniref:hypothetical protein n=1 Tax=Curtobacterium sp. MCSS17_008 TaxID=2175647 RepID=UPI000DAAC29B|nr:hypothetical protein [Curtobacterium sp. MCSS17_008]PZF55050.1 hypothetical protein DEJ23_12975 [Curtobacterium sp. MCSS17_008]
MPSNVVPQPHGADTRRIKRSRVFSFVLLALAAVVLSLRPEVFDDPQVQPWHALFHVWRIVLGIALVVAALGVQVAVGVRWRQGLRRDAGADAPGPGTPPGNQPPGDR